MIAALEPSREEIVMGLREAQAQRVSAKRGELRVKLQCYAMARRAVGWQVDLDEKQRDKAKVLGKKIVDALWAGKPVPKDTEQAAAAVEGFVFAMLPALETIQQYLKAQEKTMVSLAKSLPAYEWIEAVRGCGALGLAIIVGECGDLGDYANPSRVWKRLGLAPDECYREATLDGGTAIKKPRRRRSAMFTVGDAVIKGQVRKDKDDDGEDVGTRHGIGEYGEVYLDRKVYELAREDDGKPKNLMHAHRRAQRYMEKRIIRDLWRAWRDADGPKILGNRELDPSASR